MDDANPQPQAAREYFHDALQAVVGKVVTMVNPESLEEAPTGYQLSRGFYRAKVLALGKDYVTVVVEFVHRRKEQSKETVKQYIPLSRIKRMSVSKSEVFIHI